MSAYAEARWLSTGHLGVDAITGGGLPVGRLVEVIGGPLELAVPHHRLYIRGWSAAPRPLGLLRELVDARTPLVVLDDVASVGGSPRDWSRWMRELCGAAHRAGSTVLFVTQRRRWSDGQFTHDAALDAFRFYCALRLEVRPTEGGTEVVVVKNKFAAPYQRALLRRPALLEVGSVVERDHPDWSRARGRVLVVEEGRVLVQDLAPHGAREWWSRDEVRSS